jgi:hypothetical protein
MRFLRYALGELNDWPDGFTQADVERRLTRFRETATVAREIQSLIDEEYR